MDRRLAPRRILRSSRPQLAVKVALAATLAWQLGQLLPGTVDDYSYYAPLGAVVAMHPTVASSAGAAARSLAGVGLGVGIALAAGAVSPPNVFTVAAVVALGVLAGGIPVLGDQRAWVPMTALFVLIIGEADQSAFVFGYVGQLLLGAGISTVLNLALFPPLFLNDARESLLRAKDDVVRQVRSLAEGLERYTEVRGDAWAERSVDLRSMLTSVHHALYDVERARQANPRARRYRQLLRQRTQQAAILDRVGRLVDELTDIFIETESRAVGVLPFGTEARTVAARTLRSLAKLTSLVMDDEVLQAGVDSEWLRHAVSSVSDDIDDLAARLRHQDANGDMFAAISVVHQLRRCLYAFEAENLVEIAP